MMKAHLLRQAFLRQVGAMKAQLHQVSNYPRARVMHIYLPQSQMFTQAPLPLQRLTQRWIPQHQHLPTKLPQQSILLIRETQPRHHCRRPHCLPNQCWQIHSLGLQLSPQRPTQISLFLPLLHHHHQLQLRARHRQSAMGHLMYQMLLQLHLLRAQVMVRRTRLPMPRVLR